MTRTSEWCAAGHPDRMCDFIVSFILDRHLEVDPKARVALECQLKDSHATLSGEVTSSARFTDDELGEFVREAIREIGYTREYQDLFGAEHTIAADDVVVTVHVSRQSLDIAQGVDADGWGDQGIFFGYAVRDPKHGNMPLDQWLAREIAHRLEGTGWGGLDIKTQVTLLDGTVTEAVAAVPLVTGTEPYRTVDVKDIVRGVVGADAEVIVNGTGRYVTHGPVGDCGTTGRKLVVDFYGGNSRIGGGSPWGKDPSKADVALNVLARRKALEYLAAHPNLPEVVCRMSSVIGRSRVRISYLSPVGEELEEGVIDAPVSHVVESLGLLRPEYAERCRKGLFGYER